MIRSGVSNASGNLALIAFDQAPLGTPMLGAFERDIDALRDHLDGIERPAAATGQAARSFRRPRRCLDYNHDHGIGCDLGHGLGR